MSKLSAGEIAAEEFDHLIAVDPGPTQSAYVWIDKTGWGPEIVRFGKIDNDAMRSVLMSTVKSSFMTIEMIASYGMAVGAEVFETCVWIGRFIEVWNKPFDVMYRRDVKMFLCGNNSAKDSNIRQALIDRYGGKDKAIGKKKSQGPLYHIKDDVWAALALAETWIGTRGRRAA